MPETVQTSQSSPSAEKSGQVCADTNQAAHLQDGATPQGRTKVSRGLWAAAGLISFGLGALGAVLPILPTTPLILLAAFCFARSSEKLNNWFKSTKLYHQVFEGFVTKRSMTLKAKLSILVPVTILMAVGFAMMGRVPIGRVILAIVWVAHVIYFGFVVKTDR